MSSKPNRIPIFLLTAAAAAAGFALRRWQLAQAFSRGPTLALAAVCGLAVLAIVMLCGGLARREGYAESFSSGGVELACSILAAALLLAGNGLELLAGGQRAVCFLGILGALCILVTAVQRFRGVVPPVMLHMAPCFWLVVKLILDFRRWSVDPAVLDYCFELFAAIAAMCAVLHLGGFCYDRGKRRITVFWCLTCVLFSAVGLADGGAVRCLLLGGAALWTGVNGWQLLEEE